MISGFAAIHRQTVRHPLFRGDSARLGAWTWMVATACWRPTPFDISGQMLTLDRGQFCASIRQMAEAWGWSKSTVERFLTRLETETMIERETGHGRCIITICNYSKYQDVTERERDSIGTPDGTASGQHRDIKEPLNHKTKLKKDTRAHPLPDDWKPEPFGKGTKCEGVVSSWAPDELAGQIELFVAHHRKKGDRFASWQDAWKTWVLYSRRFGNGNRNGARASSGNGLFDACIADAAGSRR